MHSKTNTSKATILVISMGFLILHMTFEFQWAINVSLIIGLIGVASDWASQKIEWLWFKLSFVLSKIVPTLLLASVFYLILFPLSLISKLFTKDPLMLGKNYDSYFVDVKPSSIKESMEKIW